MNFKDNRNNFLLNLVCYITRVSYLSQKHQFYKDQLNMSTIFCLTLEAILEQSSISIRVFPYCKPHSHPDSIRKVLVLTAH